MVCKKCMRQIADDSVFCSYCGVPVEVQKEIEDDDCIKPHMPKKHCTSCNKELPGSAIAPLCAMCTIRQRNRELEERRKNDDKSYALRDRYDTSDEFDQSVFEQNKSNYYRGDRFAQARTARDSGFGHAAVMASLEPSPQKKNKVLIIVVVAVLCIFLIPLIFSFAGSQVYSGTKTAEKVESFMDEAFAVESTPEFEVNMADSPLLFLEGDELALYMENLSDAELVDAIDMLTSDELDEVSYQLTDDQIDTINARLENARGV